MERRRPLTRGWIAGGLLAPATLLVGLLLAIPLLYLFRSSFNRFDPMLIMRPDFTPANYARLLRDARYARILGETLLCGCAVTGLTLALGFPLAYWLARSAKRARQLLLGLVVLPFTLNTAVLAFGWVVILGRTGLINQAALALGLSAEPLRLMFTPAAVVVALAQALLPYQVLSLMAVISRIDPALEEAAADLGATRPAVIRDVVLPLAVPGVLAGSTFVFLATATAFVTPRIIGGGSVQMLGTVIYQQIFQAVNWPFAAALSFVLMAVTLATAMAANRVLRLRHLQP